MERIVNPEMLILARESRGMSQGDLAAAISVTQGKVSKYENGMLVVTPEDLEAISRALNYTQDFFFQNDKIYGLGSSFLFNRKRKHAPMQVQRKIQACINILRIQVSRLLNGVDVESEHLFDPIDSDAHNGEVEKIAQMVRAAWKIPLGPVANVTACIENAGGIVLHCNFETTLIDAAHLWLPGLPPLFFMNRDLPGDRLRMTLAHEIGHAIMHRNPAGDIENEANMFAAELLLPRKEIVDHLHNLTLEKAAALKTVWKVSMAAIVRRAYDLKCITESQYRRMFTRLSAEGYRIHEPFPIALEEPQTYKRLIAVYQSDLGYSDLDLGKLLFSLDSQPFQNNQPSILRIDGSTAFHFKGPTRHQA